MFATSPFNIFVTGGRPRERDNDRGRAGGGIRGGAGPTAMVLDIKEITSPPKNIESFTFSRRG